MHEQTSCSLTSTFSNQYASIAKIQYMYNHWSYGDFFILSVSRIIALVKKIKCALIFTRFWRMVGHRTTNCQFKSESGFVITPFLRLLAPSQPIVSRRVPHFHFPDI